MRKICYRNVYVELCRVRQLYLGEMYQNVGGVKPLRRKSSNMKLKLCQCQSLNICAKQGFKRRSRPYSSNVYKYNDEHKYNELRGFFIIL